MLLYPSVCVCVCVHVEACMQPFEHTERETSVCCPFNVVNRMCSRVCPRYKTVSYSSLTKYTKTLLTQVEVVYSDLVFPGVSGTPGTIDGH